MSTIKMKLNEGNPTDGSAIAMKLNETDLIGGKIVAIEQNLPYNDLVGISIELKNGWVISFSPTLIGFHIGR